MVRELTDPGAFGRMSSQCCLADPACADNASLVDLRDALVLFLPQITAPHTLVRPLAICAVTISQLLRVVFCIQAELLVKRFSEGCGDDITQDDKFKLMIRQNKVCACSNCVVFTQRRFACVY